MIQYSSMLNSKIGVYETTSESSVKYSTGDVNGDKDINSLDASDVLAEYARISTGRTGTFNEDQKKAANVNFDDEINASDASLILAYYAYSSTGAVNIMSIEEFFKTRYQQKTI